MEDFKPILYLLARTDIPQMNAGKLAAQASHATSCFELQVRDNHSLRSSQFNASAWRLDGFGVTITLAATMIQIRDILNETGTSFNGVVYDPTYPMYNAMGDSFTQGMSTVAWMFVETKEQWDHLQSFDLELYP